MQWIWEGRLFHMLRKIYTFNTFRKWKTFKCLQMNVRRDKNERSRYLK